MILERTNYNHHRYNHQASLICPFKSTMQYLPEILGPQLAEQISKYTASILPSVWTPELVAYINRALQVVIHLYLYNGGILRLPLRFYTKVRNNYRLQKEHSRSDCRRK